MDAEPSTEFLEPGSSAWPRLSSDDRFGSVIDGLPIAMLLTGSDGRIAMANRQAERLFGYAHGELQDQHVESLIPARLRERHLGLRQRTFADRTSRSMGEGRHLLGQRHDGSEIPLEIDLSPIDLDGKPMMLLCLTDITDRQEDEQSHEQKRRELERFNANLEEFCYAASHDLKAPLRAIGHLVQWIGEDIEPTASPGTIENLTLLRQRITRLQLLLDGLLRYAHIGYQSPAEAEDVDVAEMVRDITVMLQPPPGFVIACEGDMPVIHTHRTPLCVVLENLIANGVKHHDRHEGHVTVSMRLVNHMVEFRVADDGPGIPPRFRDRIFVIFQTLASRDDIESSGIGLALVKKKIQNQGGDIRVESAPPARGSTFVFTWAEVVP